MLRWFVPMNFLLSTCQVLSQRHVSTPVLYTVNLASCQQLLLLLVAFYWLFGFIFQVPCKYSGFLSEGVV